MRCVNFNLKNFWWEGVNFDDVWCVLYFVMCFCVCLWWCMFCVCLLCVFLCLLCVLWVFVLFVWCFEMIECCWSCCWCDVVKLMLWCVLLMLICNCLWFCSKSLVNWFCLKVWGWNSWIRVFCLMVLGRWWVVRIRGFRRRTSRCWRLCMILMDCFWKLMRCLWVCWLIVGWGWRCRRWRKRWRRRWRRDIRRNGKSCRRSGTRACNRDRRIWRCWCGIFLRWRLMRWSMRLCVVDCCWWMIFLICLRWVSRRRRGWRRRSARRCIRWRADLWDLLIRLWRWCYNCVSVWWNFW